MRKYRPLGLLPLILTWAAATGPLAAGQSTMPAPGAVGPSLAPPRFGSEDAAIIGHRIEARIDPGRGEIQVTDRLTLPARRDHWDLLLHRELSPRVVDGPGVLVPRGQRGHLEAFRLRLTGDGPVTLAYGGRIRHELTAMTEGMGRERQITAGTIGPEGVFLDGASGWYPRVPDSLQTFDLSLELPSGWRGISQGSGPEQPGGRGDAWSETQPQDDIYLIAAPFTLYRQAGGQGEAQVWLRRPDQPLAERYLAATRSYLDLYSDLIGPYPYAKFALVENFWETGYGMPSFTLLGPRVIRLPFILDTSYPHEVLHNWWGNGVFVDYQGGNWSEGLTAYLADHLMAERRGLGADYRRDTLKSYADYVRQGHDFPLTAFRARHGSASQAIGYGKSAMVFHMLRQRLGDQDFIQALREFYANQRFRTAGWSDLRHAFEAASGSDLGDFFAAWTNRSGAPRLGLADVRVAESDAGLRLSGRVIQTQTEAPFPLTVPLLIHQTQGPAQRLLVGMEGRTRTFALDLDSQPLRLSLDPAFDTFRELMPGESPVALSTLFGSAQGLILVPDDAESSLRQGYLALAEAWVADHPGWELRTDSQTEQLPDDRALWILGWENRHTPAFAAVSRGFTLDPAAGTLLLDDTSYNRGDASPVLTATRAGQPLGWLAAAHPAALPGLTRKVPHYGKYGYLVFSGAAPENRTKGQWPAGDSELVHWFGSARPELPRQPEEPLGTATDPAPPAVSVEQPRSPQATRNP